jgi:hypothetical protein
MGPALLLSMLLYIWNHNWDEHMKTTQLCQAQSSVNAFGWACWLLSWLLWGYFLVVTFCGRIFEVDSNGTTSTCTMWYD